MKLDKRHIDKIDVLLEDALLNARGDELLKVVIVLDSQRANRETLSQQLSQQPKPSEFPNRNAWREALIAQRQTQLAKAIGDQIQGLKDLSLTTRGGITTNILVVEGAARQILRALELPGVSHASLNQPLVRLLPDVSPETVEHLAEMAIEIYQENANNFLFWKNNSLNERTRQSIVQASQQYLQNYIALHGKVQVLGMRHAVDLDSIYTAVQLLEEGEIRQYESLDALERTFRQRQQRRFQSKEASKQTGISVANQEKYLMVLGGPGAGKSTFLRKMGLEALKGKKGQLNHRCIPVFIELKQFSDSNIEIETKIASEFESCGFPSPNKFTASALEQGRLLILLDGLDELPTKKLDWVIERIQEFVEKFYENRFIASCRTAAYRRKFVWFSNAAIADFDNTQIEQFIGNWFQSEADKQARTADRCWKLLQKRENANAKELAQTPLLLTFLCLVYDKSQNFPNNRSELYGKALQILLEEWITEKRVQRDEVFQELDAQLEEILLSEIAYQGFQADKLFFPQLELVEQIKTFLAGNLNAPQHLDGEAVFNAITVQQGILVERAQNVYSFSHLTLQEYLTAEYIEYNRLFEQLVTDRLIDTRWHEVFLLVAGLMRGGADELLLLMEKEAQKFINTPKLSGLLRWADRITAGSESDIKPVGKRAIAIFNAYAKTNAKPYIITNTNANANAIAIAYAYTNANVYAYAYAYPIVYAYAIDYTDVNSITNLITYVSKLEKLKVFNYVNLFRLLAILEDLKLKITEENKPYREPIKFGHSTIKTLLDAFNLSSEMVNLSETEANAIGNYLYVNNLIIQCQKAAVRVSPQTWEAIEHRMLRLPE